jgi:hypothetical protein
MLIVCAEQALVEAELVAGVLSCPSCRGLLGPWGHGRERVLRCLAGDWLLRPRRAAFSGCCPAVLRPDTRRWQKGTLRRPEGAVGAPSKPQPW